MLALIFLFVYVLWVSFECGALVWHDVLKKTFSNRWHYTGVGIIIIAVVARWWSLMSPTSWLIHIPLAGIAVWSSIRNQGLFFRSLWAQKWLFGLALIPVTYFCALQSISYDEALYHASFIRWLNEYGIVNGLGNLHGRLAFNSTWHVLASVFNMRFLTGQPLNQLNGFFILWLILFLGEERKLWKHIPAISNFGGLVFPFLFFPIIAVYHVVDPSADFVITFWALLLLYELFFFEEKQQDNALLFYLSVSVFLLISIKISAVVLLLPVAVILLRKPGLLIKRVMWLALPALLIIVPWLISNYMLSGYLLYPNLSLKMLNPEWKIPDTIATVDLNGIKYGPFSRWANLPVDEVMAMGRWERYHLWFQHLRILDKLLLGGTLVAYLMLLATCWVGKKPDYYKRLAIYTGFVGFAFVCYTVPDFRFMAGYSYFSVILLVVLFYRKPIAGWLFAAAGIATFGISVKLYQHLQPVVANTDPVPHSAIRPSVVLPYPYPVSHCDSMKVNGIPVYIFNEANKEFNWDHNPGTYAPVMPFGLIGQSPASGFKPQ